jgi:hypothetical protein
MVDAVIHEWCRVEVSCLQICFVAETSLSRSVLGLLQRMLQVSGRGRVVANVVVEGQLVWDTCPTTLYIGCLKWLARTVSRFPTRRSV